MDIAVPSRFACLKIEGEDTRPPSAKPKEAKKKAEKKPGAKKTDKEAKPVDKAVSAKKTNGSKQPSSAPSASKKDKKKQNAQWEEWKQKDSEIANGNFKEDLQNAILLSTLEFQCNKQNQEEVEKEKSQVHKKKKNKVMSLEQFLNSGNTTDKSKGDNSDTNLKTENDVKDENFFDKIQQDAKEELTKEHLKEKRQKREANIDEVISLAQCQQKFEEAKKKCTTMKVEIERLKSENADIKERNKTLCKILGQGEMKDKADVLLELERLYSEKKELSDEVSKLHVLLEQERSKVAALTADPHNKHKDKNKK